MIDAASIAVAIRIAISAFVLCWLGFWLYRDYWVERFRQEMFALRDEMFVDAANGLIPFSHPAYGLLRGTMNGFIRFGQRMSLLELCAFRLFLKPVDTPESFASRWEASLEDLSEDVKAEMGRYLTRMHLATLKYVVLGSPISAVTIIMPTLFFFACRYYITILLDSFSESLNEIDSAAMDCGASGTGDMAPARLSFSGR